MIQFNHALHSVAAALLVLTPLLAAHAAPAHDANRSHYQAPRASETPQIDGIADDAGWQQAEWRPLNNLWLGPELSAEDFQGRYKLVWTPSKLFVLVEFVDDILIDSHRNPLLQYWDDDCLEIFIDENHSGGDHQYNHNAFAYHLSLDNQAIDIGTDKQAHNYSSHVQSHWQQQGNKVNWEVAIDIYTEAYQDGGNDNRPIALEAGKIMGFMLAYCDNDGSELRENFIGSEFAAGDHKDRGWIDASLFGTLELLD